MYKYIFALALFFPTVLSAVTLNPESITRYSPALSPTLPANGYPNQALVGDFYRNVMVFDLSGVTEEIVGATLDIDAGYGTQVSIGTSRTYSIWDVSSPIDDIARRVQGGPAQSYYDDIGSGVLYGSTTVPVHPTNGANPLPSPGVTVDLTGALPDLNAAKGGKIAFGGTSPETFYMFFGASDFSSVSLTLVTQPAAVPLPAGVPLLLSGIGAFFIVSRRKRARSRNLF